MSARFATRLAWALCVASLMLLGLTLLIAFLARSTPVPEGGTAWRGQAILAVGLAGAPVLGALIASRRPDNPYGWLWLGFGLAWALLSFAQSYAEYAVASGKLPAPGTVAMAGGVVWVAGGALTPLLMLLFPDGRLPSPRWRFLVWTVLAAGAVSVVLGLFLPGQGIASVENPFGVGGRVGEVIFALIATGVFVIFGCTLLSALSLIFRYRRAGGVERQQIKWFAYAAVAFGGSIIFGGFLGWDLPGIWDALFEAVTLSGLYVAVGVAILRYRLYEIDLIINPTLVYGLLTATLVLVYLGGVVLPRYVFHALTGQESQLAVVASTLVIAALFNPLRRRIQIFIDRLFTGAGTTRRRPSRPSRRDFGMRPISAGWVTSWSRRCGRPCSRRTPRCGCARQLGSARRKGEARCEKISVRGVFVTLFVTFGRRSGPRMVVKEVR